MSVIVSKRLLDSNKAAEYLSISRTTVYYLVKKERILSIRIGKKRLFAVEDLDLFVDNLKSEQQKKICDET